MARLILREGEQTRRFKLNNGKLSIGSGAEATITVDSDEVAEVHLELEFRDGKAVLRPRRGVAPVTIRGQKVSGEGTLAPGATAKFGGVSLSIELEDAAPTPSAPKAGRSTGSGARKVSKASPAGRRAGGGASSGSRVQRQRRTMSGGRSLPSWLIVALLLLGAGAVIMMLDNFAEDSAEVAFDPRSSQVRIEDLLANRVYAGVLSELEEKIEPNMASLTPEWKRTFEGYRKRALNLQEEAEAISRNIQGNEYFGPQLKRYQEGYLKDNGRPQARVLLKRIEEFRRRWPTHPELDWCDRMERRYGEIANMSSPDEWPDVEWEVKTLTWAKPRRYKEAFAVLKGFYELSAGADRDAALALMEEKATEEKEYFDDRILEAKHQYENKKDYETALGELLYLVEYLEDNSLADQAATRISQMPNIEGSMAAVKREMPEKFERLKANAVMRSYLQKIGLL